jgi:hypothetical protein
MVMHKNTCALHNSSYGPQGADAKPFNKVQPCLDLSTSRTCLWLVAATSAGEAACMQGWLAAGGFAATPTTCKLG